MLEKMSEFFTKRTVGYDEHMLNEVEGCREGYIKMASLIPKGCLTLLDLGCGTGLELDEIFKLHPDLAVVGIDMTASMLRELKRKHPEKRLELIEGDYFKVPFGKEKFDIAVSFETLHHFTAEKKLGLYEKIFASLKQGGAYIECDYMVETQAEEDAIRDEYARLRCEQGIIDEEFYHFDTPLTVKKQIEILRSAGFASVEPVFKIGNTVMLLSKK